MSSWHPGSESISTPYDAAGKGGTKARRTASRNDSAGQDFPFRRALAQVSGPQVSGRPLVNAVPSSSFSGGSIPTLPVHFPGPLSWANHFHRIDSASLFSGGFAAIPTGPGHAAHSRFGPDPYPDDGTNPFRSRDTAPTGRRREMCVTGGAWIGIPSAGNRMTFDPAAGYRNRGTGSGGAGTPSGDERAPIM